MVNGVKAQSPGNANQSSESGIVSSFRDTIKQLAWGSSPCRGTILTARRPVFRTEARVLFLNYFGKSVDGITKLGNVALSELPRVPANPPAFPAPGGNFWLV